MTSIIPGYEYDIFISYRHNDNRSGWVTEFVKALQEELAATIKEPVSVYFDTNPHDGLLETHNVDKSLEGKLKCLIFIPILSQTYCDPKSFAWQHEFCAFNKLAKEDQFGRDIKLNNGNVGSRILPVKIHDLDAEDKATIENEIGAVLRPIEFIYKEMGVNRPLKPSDTRNENQNKTDYRNQVNKLANAIKDLATRMKNPNRQSRLANDREPQPKLSAGRVKKSIVVTLTLVLIIGLFLLYQQFNQPRQLGLEPSVAVLAFKDLSPQHDQEWFSDGLSEEILNSLRRLKKLKVMSQTSSSYFKDRQFTIAEIGGKLGVANVVEGSVKRLGNQLRITARLVSTKDGVQIWGKEYDRPADDLLKVQMDIAENIARNLLAELSGADQANMAAADKPKNPEAYEHFIKGIWFFIQWDNTFDPENLRKAEAQFIQAIESDPGYASPYALLANLYNDRAPDGSNNQLRDSLMEMAYRLNPRALMVLRAKSFFYFERPIPLFDSAFYFLKLAYRVSPNDPLVNKTAYQFYSRAGLPDLAEKFAQKAVEEDPLSSLHLSALAYYQLLNGKSAMAKASLMKVLELDSANLFAYVRLRDLAIVARDRKALETINRNLEKSKTMGSHDLERSIRGQLLAFNGHKQEALKLQTSRYEALQVFYLLNDQNEMLTNLDSMNAENSAPSYVDLENNALYNGIRQDSRFKKTLLVARERDQARRKKYERLDEDY